MLKIYKGLLSIVATGALVVGVSPNTVHADNIDESIENNTLRLNEAKNEKEEARLKLNNISKDIEEAEERADEILSLTEETHEEIRLLKVEIEELEGSIEKRDLKLQEQVRTIQTNGEKIDIVSIVIEAESLSEIIGKARVVNSILSSNNDMLNMQVKDKQSIERKETQTRAKLEHLQDLGTELEMLKGELMSKVFEEERLLRELDSEIEETEDLVRDLKDEKLAKEEREREVERERLEAERAIDIQRREVVNQIIETESMSLDGIPENAKANEVIENASKYLGVPYVWGGRSPSGFDCSGFTQYVYQETYGINIGGWTGAQQYSGSHISVSEAKAGDLLMWGKGSSTSHVAIYLGNGHFIHAPKPGDVVKVTALKHFMPDYAIRVVK